MPSTVTERFLRYVKFATTSDEASETVPSTAGQKVLGAALVDELLALGLADAEMDGQGYVYATLPASPDCAHLPAIGLIAHMDTSPDVSGEGVKPRILSYTGGDIPLGNGECISVAAFPFLEHYVGQELIVTDGTTLLGADDKAGVAEIITACEYLLAHPQLHHPTIAVCFTPDEEIGRGTDHFTFGKFAAKAAYTVDGGELGEIEYENFNAASATVTIKGVNIHPGTAKNKMKNAALLAAELVAAMPAAETPAHTEGYEGFYHVTDIHATTTDAEVCMIIRDHDREKFEARKAFVARLVDYLNAVHGEGTFALSMRDSYYNMKEKILPHMELIDRARAAMDQAGVAPITVPIRGGTDGARLSWEGLPCPNLSTGGMNFHGIHECISVQSMEKMVQVLVNLAVLFGQA
ncbi:MAG: peptidase T [Clostridia bacterium]|nr:peptidase T [Clostridia bacterium]